MCGTASFHVVVATTTLWHSDAAIAGVAVGTEISLRPPHRSLHGLRNGRDRFVRSLHCYYEQVRLLHHAHRRLRPPAFPTRSRPRLVGPAMEISRFPDERLMRMPGSTTTRGRLLSCDDGTNHLAFCWTENISAPNLSYAAQYLAYTLPCQR